MADRSLAIRLAVIDGGKVKAELREVGDTGSRALQRIEDAAQPASRALQALDGVAGEVRGGIEASFDGRAAYDDANATMLRARLLNNVASDA